MALPTAARVPLTEIGHPGRGRIAALDGLRGIAVIAVMLFHAGVMPGGFLGVDLFFVLSGYLITSLLLDEVDLSGRVDLVAFWGRRFRRLLPAALVLLVAITLIATLVATAPERLAMLGDGPWAQAYLANWHAIAGRTGYWASFDLPRLFGHLWSLAIEEQFYVVWPIVMVVIVRRAQHVRRTVMVTCLVAALLSLVQMIRLFDPADPTRVYIGTDTRMSGLLLGAMLAALPKRQTRRRYGFSWSQCVTPVSAAVVVALALSWLTVDGPTSPWLFRGGLFVHSALAATLVVACASEPGAALFQWIGSRPLRVVGQLSYGLYLWHWPIFVLFSEQRTGLSGVTLLVYRLVLSTGAAWLSKRLIEDPIRWQVRWSRGRQGLSWLAVVSLAMVTLWVVAPRPNDTPPAFAAADLPAVGPAAAVVLQPERAMESPMPATRQPHVEATTAPSMAASTSTALASPTPTLPILAATERVLVLGDSVSYDEWPAVSAALAAAGVEVAQSVAPGAGLFDRNSEWSASIPESIGEARPDLVIYQGSLWDFGTVDEQRVVYQHLTDVVLATGARLVLVTLPPLRADQHNDGLTSLGMVMTEIADAHPESVVMLDGASAWGAEFDDDLNDDGIPERKPDGVHVCPSGAAMYAVWLTTHLQQHFAGFTPAPTEDWAEGAWSSDRRYLEPDGICALLS